MLEKFGVLEQLKPSSILQKKHRKRDRSDVHIPMAKAIKNPLDSAPDRVVSFVSIFSYILHSKGIGWKSFPLTSLMTDIWGQDLLRYSRDKFSEEFLVTIKTSRSFIGNYGELERSAPLAFNVVIANTFTVTLFRSFLICSNLTGKWKISCCKFWKKLDHCLSNLLRLLHTSAPRQLFLW